MIHILRSLLHLLLFACSAVLLGLTASRIHTSTTHNLFGLGHFYNPVTAELLATAVLGVIIGLIFMVLLPLKRRSGANSGVGDAVLTAEALSLFVLWIMFLIGASVFTRRWRRTILCDTSRACSILRTIVAFSWICFGLTTLLLLAVLAAFFMHKDRNTTRRTTHETRNVAGATAATGGLAAATSDRGTSTSSTVVSNAHHGVADSDAAYGGTRNADYTTNTTNAGHTGVVGNTGVVGTGDGYGTTGTRHEVIGTGANRGVTGTNTSGLPGPIGSVVEGVRSPAV